MVTIALRNASPTQNHICNIWLNVVYFMNRKMNKILCVFILMNRRDDKVLWKMSQFFYG